MALDYAYYYAIIDLETGMCIEVADDTDYFDPEEHPDYIRIPSPDMVYLMKYYNRADGKWYYDEEFQNEATELNG